MLGFCWFCVKLTWPLPTRQILGKFLICPTLCSHFSQWVLLNFCDSFVNLPHVLQFTWLKAHQTKSEQSVGQIPNLPSICLVGNGQVSLTQNQQKPSICLLGKSPHVPSVIRECCHVWPAPNNKSKPTEPSHMPPSTRLAEYSNTGCRGWFTKPVNCK